VSFGHGPTLWSRHEKGKPDDDPSTLSSTTRTPALQDQRMPGQHADRPEMGLNGLAPIGVGSLIDVERPSLTHRSRCMHGVLSRGRPHDDGSFIGDG